MKSIAVNKEIKSSNNNPPIHIFKKADDIDMILKWGGLPRIYVIQKNGETFYSIARKFNILLKDLIDLNTKLGVLISADILRPNTLLQKGMKIYLPIFETIEAE